MTATDETAVLSRDDFQRFSQQVYRWAYRVLGNHQDAQDVVQDVYMDWSRQCMKDIPRHPAAWLRTASIHRAIDMNRRKQSARDAAMLLTKRHSREHEIESRNVDPLDQEIMRGRVVGALARLSELQQAVVVAKVWDELTFASIAAELGLAVSTVKTHYLRGIQALRSTLEIE